MKQNNGSIRENISNKVYLTRESDSNNKNEN